MKYLKLTLAASTLVLSTSVNAALISTDWQNVGDNFITQDTDSGLEWLDLTETVGMSYDQVTAQMATGGSLAGWSYATSSQISGFFDSAGGSGDYTGSSEANNGVVESVSTFWGYSRALTKFSKFLFAEVDTARPDANHRYGQISDGVNNTNWETEDYMVIMRASWPDTSGESFTSSALVRTSVVPVPAAVWLFGSGLIGLIGIARRKKA